MKKRFNVTGPCSPQKHYMVPLDERLKKIKEDYVDYGSYFAINRGRQYGKTTTLQALGKYLRNDYIVLSLDFQQIGTEYFADAQTFVQAFTKKLIFAFQRAESHDEEELLKMLTDFQNNNKNVGLSELFECLSSICEKSARPIVLMIDEVDSASNNQVFVDFLAQLRGYYLNREETPIFHSVILAGVYSVKNLRLKLRSESEHRYNSPWNIAADFDLDMNFSIAQIVQMLVEYEADKHTGMDMQAVAREIYAYTSGYPVLVSSICKRIDEKIAGRGAFINLCDAWSKEGVDEAVKDILKNGILLFESMVKQLDLYKDLRNMIEDIIYRGKRITFSPEQKSINLGVMFGFLKEADGCVMIANRMFEMCLLNMFAAEESGSEVYSQGGSDRILFIKNNRLDMDLVMKKFVEYFEEIYSEKDAKFVEKQGRKIFLLYLKPIINGVGNYYIEAQTRDERRTDVIVDYRGEQFIIELKIWHGNEYRERGEEQLTDYLDYYHKDRGYMLSFNFNKHKKTGIKKIQVGSRSIVEAVV